MARGEVVWRGCFEGRAEEGEDAGAEGVACGLEAEDQWGGGGERGGEWLEGGLWRGDVEGFFWVALLR